MAKFTIPSWFVSTIPAAILDRVQNGLDTVHSAAVEQGTVKTGDATRSVKAGKGKASGQFVFAFREGKDEWKASPSGPSTLLAWLWRMEDARALFGEFNVEPPQIVADWFKRLAEKASK